MKRIFYMSLVLFFILYGGFSARGQVVPEYEEYTLSNGFRVILVEDHNQPLIDFRFSIMSGSACDSASHAGRAALTIDMMETSTENYTSEEFNRKLDSSGGRIEGLYFRETSGFYGTFLSRDIEFALNIFAEIVKNPAFRGNDFEDVKKRMVSYNVRQRSITERMLKIVLFNSIYGDQGLGLPVSGTLEGLDNLAPEDIVSFYNNNFNPDNAVMVIAGDIDSRVIKRIIKRNFSDWKKKGSCSPIIVNRVEQDSLNIIIIDNPTLQSAEFLIGAPAFPAQSEEIPSLIILDYILGGGGETSRLYESLIQDYAVATSVRSWIEWSRHYTMQFIYGASTSDMAPDAIRKTLEVIENMRQLKISIKQLELGRNFFTGYIPGLFENTYSTVRHFGELVSYGLEPTVYNDFLDDLQEISPEKLRNVARDIYAPSNMTIVVIGPEYVLRPGLSDLGKIRVISTGRE